MFILKLYNCFGSKNVFEKSASFMLYIQVIYVRTIPGGIYVLKVNSKDTRTTPLKSFWCLYC